MLVAKGRVDLVVNDALYPPEHSIVGRACPKHQHLVGKMADPGEFDRYGWHTRESLLGRCEK